MKVINNLIVIDVPKSYKEFRIKMGELQFNHNGVTGRITGLESGDYEIIGLYSEVVNDEEKREEVLHYGHASGLVYTMLLDTGIDWQKLPDTTDLLFLKRI